MKRFLAWLLILMLMIPAAALADIPVIPIDDPSSSSDPSFDPGTAFGPTSSSVLPTYNPWATTSPWITTAPDTGSRTLRQGMTGSDVLKV